MTDAKCAECETCSGGRPAAAEGSADFFRPLNIFTNLKDYDMDENQRETSPLLRQEEVDKVEVYPIIHMIRSDIIVSSCLLLQT
jgi:hypothetical protein